MKDNNDDDDENYLPFNSIKFVDWKECIPVYPLCECACQYKTDKHDCSLVKSKLKQVSLDINEIINLLNEGDK